MKRGRRVARAAAQSGAHGDPFGELDRHAERAASRFERRTRRAHGKIGLGGAEIRTVHRERDAGLGTGDHELVRELEQRERRLNLVIAPPRPPCRRFAREDTQQEVELGVCRDTHPVHWFSPSELQTEEDRGR